MKAAVFSDTHGNTALMVEAIKRTRPDIVIHLGDYERDTQIIRREFPDIPLYSVCGNCDFAPLSPLADIVPMGTVKALICHGHSYGVEYNNIDRLVYFAQEQNCNLAMFGHTHNAYNGEAGGVKVVNPGTAGKGRHLTYAFIEVFDNGGIASEIRDL